MNRIQRIFALLLVCVFVLTAVSCTAPNVDRRLVGTLVSLNYGEKSTYIFRSNGTFERDYWGNHSEGKYTAVDGVLTFDYGEKYQKKKVDYKVNENKSSEYYGEIKIGLEYFRKK